MTHVRSWHTAESEPLSACLKSGFCLNPWASLTCVGSCLIFLASCEGKPMCQWLDLRWEHVKNDEPMETNFSNQMFSSEIIILHIGFQLEKTNGNHPVVMTTTRPWPHVTYWNQGHFALVTAGASRGDGDHGPMTIQLSDYPLIWHIIHLYGGFHQWGYQQMDGL